MLVCDYQHSGFRFFTKSKLLAARADLPRSLPRDMIEFARAISAALMEKQTGGVYEPDGKT